jgi:hypothetical protein
LGTCQETSGRAREGTDFVNAMMATWFGNIGAESTFRPDFSDAGVVAVLSQRLGPITKLCSPARKLGASQQKRSFKRSELGELILNLLRQHLMQPEAVLPFIAEFASQTTPDWHLRTQITNALKQSVHRSAAVSTGFTGLLPLDWAHRV